MSMNGINGVRITGPGAVPPVSAPATSGVARPRPAPAADSVELSEDARKLLQESSSGEGRRALVEAARAKLESGRLDTPENRARAAENLLRSGDLNRAAE